MYIYPGFVYVQIKVLHLNAVNQKKTQNQSATNARTREYMYLHAKNLKRNWRRKKSVMSGLEVVHHLAERQPVLQLVATLAFLAIGGRSIAV